MDDLKVGDLVQFHDELYPLGGEDRALYRHAGEIIALSGDHPFSHLGAGEFDVEIRRPNGSLWYAAPKHLIPWDCVWE